MGGVPYVATRIARRGVIRNTGTIAKVHCGRLDGRPDAVLAGYVEQMQAANIDITLTEQMRVDLWESSVLPSRPPGTRATTRQPMGVIREEEDMRALFYTLMHETIAVGRASGVT